MDDRPHLPLPEPRVSFGPAAAMIRLAPGDYYTADQMRTYAAAAVAAERERWKVMMRRAIATCFDQRAHHEVMSCPQHFAAEALRA